MGHYLTVTAEGVSFGGLLLAAVLVLVVILVVVLILIVIVLILVVVLILVLVIHVLFLRVMSFGLPQGSIPVLLRFILWTENDACQ